jgi:hypothetical protein
MVMRAVVLLVGALVLAVAAACAGQTYVHRRFRDVDFVAHNEVGGVMMTAVGTLYAVLLGFLTVVAWQHSAEARRDVTLEAAAGTDAWHAAAGLPPVERGRLRHDILRYASQMTSSEWTAMRGGGFDPAADMIVMDAINTVGTYKPTNVMEANAQAATLTQLSALHDARQLRLADNASGLSWFEWLVLFVGAACVVGFCWLFGLANKRIHLIMTACVAILITSVLVLLYELQSPFRGDLAIGPATWTAVLEHIQIMRSRPEVNMRM